MGTQQRQKAPLWVAQCLGLGFIWKLEDSSSARASQLSGWNTRKVIRELELHFPLPLTLIIPCCLVYYTPLLFEGNILKHRYVHANTLKKWIPEIIVYNLYNYCTQRHKRVRGNCGAVSLLEEGFSPPRAEHNDQTHLSAACSLLWSSLTGTQLALFSFWSTLCLLREVKQKVTLRLGQRVWNKETWFLSLNHHKLP